MIYLIAITVIIGTLRFILPVSGGINKSDIYKDVAHLFVGGLFGAAFATSLPIYWQLGLGLMALEVVAFLIRKRK